MSKQLALASAFSVFALSALALFAPSGAQAPGNVARGPGAELAVPVLSAQISSLLD